MSPRELQNEIKQNFSVDEAVWSSYRTAIVNNFASINYQDLSDHLLREFNRKIVNLGLSGDLMFSPHDAGFRFLGSVISNPGPAAAYIAAITSAGATVSAPQQAAVSTFMSDEIAAGRWDKMKRLYFPLWEVGTANAICMKSLTSGTFVNSVRHESDGIDSGIIGSGYMNTNVSIPDLGIANSYHYAVLLTGSLQDSYDAPFGNTPDVCVLGYDSEYDVKIANLQISIRDISPDNLGILTLGGNTSSRYVKSRNAARVAKITDTSSFAAPSYPSSTKIYLLARAESNGAPNAGYNGTIGAFSMATELTDAEDTAYTLSLRNLYNRIRFNKITGLDWQNYADETINYVIELNKAGVAYA